MFRILSLVATLTMASAAAGSIAVSAVREAEHELRAAARAALPKPRTQPPAGVLPSQPYRMTPNTEVWLDGHPADYQAIPAGARIAYLEVTLDGAIRTVYFLSPTEPPSPRSGCRSQHGPRLNNRRNPTP